VFIKVEHNNTVLIIEINIYSILIPTHSLLIAIILFISIVLAIGKSVRLTKRKRKGDVVMTRHAACIIMILVSIRTFSLDLSTFSGSGGLIHLSH